MKKPARKKSPAKQLMTRQGKGPRWGKAHEQRGLRYADYAVSLIQEFPIGTKFTTDQLDTWLESQNLLEIPVPVDKSSDAWKAHVRRRDRCIPKLRAAGLHPRMRDEFQLPTFNLVYLGQAEWVIQAPQDVVHERIFLLQIDTYIETCQRYLGHLMQGIDFSQLPSHELPLAEGFYDDFAWLRAMNHQYISSINVKFSRIQQKIEDILRRGQAPLQLPE